MNVIGKKYLFYFFDNGVKYFDGPIQATGTTIAAQSCNSELILNF